MLSPVIAVPASSSTLKAQATSTDIGAGHSVVLPPSAMAQQVAAEQIGMEMPAGNLLASVNAVAATAGNRTVLQTLAQAVAALLNISRRNDETVAALFQRIAAAIDDLGPAERMQIEIRSGLKALKISLTDLSAALKSPDSAVAARLTAMAEAPFATPGKTAANAATGTYLLDGTGTAQAAETLAMRTAARATAAGYGLFSAETTNRPSANPVADARELQTQLKSLFEPGAGDSRNSASATATPTAGEPGSAGKPADQTFAVSMETSAEPSAIAVAPTPANGDAMLKQAVEAARDSIEKQVIELGSPVLEMPHEVDALVSVALPEIPEELLLPIDEPLSLPLADPRDKKAPVAAGTKEVLQAGLERVREAKKEIQSERVFDEKKSFEKIEQNDRRLQTILTLKGFAETLTTLPGKAADLLAPLVEKGLLNTDARKMPNPADLLVSHPATTDVETIAHRNATGSRQPAIAAESTRVAHLPVETMTEDEADTHQRTDARSQPHDAGNETKAMDDSKAAVLKSALGQDMIPFAYAPLQPAREEFRAKRRDDDERDERPESEHQHDRHGDDASDGNERRSRDEYDEMRDETMEAEMPIKITRDSSEADRAFALYSRMGGF